MNVNKSLISINALHNEIEESLKASLLKAIQVGEYLSNVKEQLPHGEFTGWIKDNLSFTGRMARNYMRLFANKDKLQGADISITEAVKLLQTSDGFADVVQAIDRHLVNAKDHIIDESGYTEAKDLTYKFLNKAKGVIAKAKYEHIPALNTITQQCDVIIGKWSEATVRARRMVGEILNKNPELKRK